MICNCCPRECGAIRNEHYGQGFCGAGLWAKVSRVAPHYWEEPCLSGSRGSGTVFFSGCSLGCVFCQNQKISRDAFAGKELNAKQLSSLFARVEELGVHNINLVTPTHFASTIIEALTIRKPGIPVIWNSSGYEKPEMIYSLRGLVDIFLPDFKYAFSDTSMEMAKAPDYFQVALSAIRVMCEISGSPRYDDNSMMIRGTIVRHLVLPMRTKDSFAILDAIAHFLPQDTPVSLMRQYTPLTQSSVKGLNRSLTKREYDRAVEHMLELGLTGFTQSRESIMESFVPEFLDEQSLQLLNECTADE